MCLSDYSVSPLFSNEKKMWFSVYLRTIVMTYNWEFRRMKDLREYIGNEASLDGKIIRTQIRWAGHD